ncbi:MAG: YlbF family regulator [Lachnospiraceae bacterium]|nr:YlbF family regulator [Lachnospiraceae bacterium]MBR2276007.1 YlbF family regulator [Lachnospiraceae bacterium]
MDEKLEQAVNALIEQLLSTDEYVSYLKEKDRVGTDEECMEKIRKFRRLSYELQNLTDEQRVHEGAKIEAECDNLCSDMRVLDFMEAEIAFVRLYQGIIRRIIKEIDIEE